MNQTKTSVHRSKKECIAKMCTTCKESKSCIGIRHCKRRISGGKDLPRFDPTIQ